MYYYFRYVNIVMGRKLLSEEKVIMRIAKMLNRNHRTIKKEIENIGKKKN